MTKKKLKQPKKKIISPITQLREARREIKDLDRTLTARNIMLRTVEIKFEHQKDMIEVYKKTIITLEKTIFALARAH